MDYVKKRLKKLIDAQNKTDKDNIFEDITPEKTNEQIGRNARAMKAKIDARNQLYNLLDDE